jgi:hypothetical protein
MISDEVITVTFRQNWVNLIMEAFFEKSKVRHEHHKIQ